jgi:hypothetical protein
MTNRRTFLAKCVGAVVAMAVAPLEPLLPRQVRELPRQVRELPRILRHHPLNTEMAELAGRRLAEEVERRTLGLRSRYAERVVKPLLGTMMERGGLRPQATQGNVA